MADIQNEKELERGDVQRRQHTHLGQSEKKNARLEEALMLFIFRA